MQNNFCGKKNVHFDEFLLLQTKKVVILQRKNGGTVAQLVEQRTENPRVTGSIPVGTTLWKRRIECVSFFVHNPVGLSHRGSRNYKRKRLP